MCAKVKAEVQNIAHELVVSGLDSATSLIQVHLFRLKNQNLFLILGRQKLDELCRVYGKIVICRLHQIQKPRFPEQCGTKIIPFYLCG